MPVTVPCVHPVPSSEGQAAGSAFSRAVMVGTATLLPGQLGVDGADAGHDRHAYPSLGSLAGCRGPVGRGRRGVMSGGCHRVSRANVLSRPVGLLPGL